MRIYQYGEPEAFVCEEAPRPVAGTGEVLVQVRAAGINPIDWKTRAGIGLARIYGEKEFPLILGWDVSGVVEQVGEGVRDLTPGDEVFGMVRFPGVGAAYAEYVACPAEHLVKKPAVLSHVEAAALPLAALTAWQALFDIGRLEAGQHVLVQAAAGGVGHLAVQLAKARGAYVTGTASARSAAFVVARGADAFVDYTAPDWEQTVAGMDVVLGAIAGTELTRALKTLRPGGRLVSMVGKPEEAVAETLGVSWAQVSVRPDRAELQEIADLASAGRVKPVIDRVFPLTDAAAAHRYGQAGHTRGKLVLTVS